MGLGHDVATHVNTFAPDAITLCTTVSDLLIRVRPNVLAVEMNIIAHEIPGFVDSGNKLYGWFTSVLGMYLRESIDVAGAATVFIDTVILVADNYERVPTEKHAEQSRRRDAGAPTEARLPHLPTPPPLTRGVCFF